MTKITVSSQKEWGIARHCVNVLQCRAMREQTALSAAEPLKWGNTAQLLVGTHTVTGQNEREGVSEVVAPQWNPRLHISLL